MQITLEHWHSTPIFSVKTDTEIGWASVFGHTKTKEGWAYPAYYPFGMWVLRDLNALGLNINFDSNALSQVQLLRQHHSQLCAAEQAYEQKQYPDLPLPSGFQWHLTPFRHQALGIAQLFYRHRHFLLWEMGTGKTKVAVESLRLLKKLGQVKRAVVLCPPVVISTWESEILRHSNGELTSLPWIPSNQHTRADLKKLSETVDVVIMSYARARMEVLDYATKSWTINNVDQMNEYRKIAGKSQFTAKELDDYKTYAATNFLDIPFDIIIADEVHSIGNFESDQTKSVLKISSKIPRRIELTGTAGDRPEKMYPLLQYLSPALLNMSFTQFKEKHLEISDQLKLLGMLQTQL
jgi:SNF2 family DNA or RNA helicase